MMESPKTVSQTLSEHINYIESENKALTAELAALRTKLAEAEREIGRITAERDCLHDLLVRSNEHRPIGHYIGIPAALTQGADDAGH